MRIFVFSDMETLSEIRKSLPPGIVMNSHTGTSNILWEEVRKSDCIWYFQKIEKFEELYKKFIHLNIPLICNFNSGELPGDLDSKLREARLLWINSETFSPMSNLIKDIMSLLRPTITGNDVNVSIRELSGKQTTTLNTPRSYFTENITKETKIFKERLSCNPLELSLGVEYRGEKIYISYQQDSLEMALRRILQISFGLVFSFNKKRGYGLRSAITDHGMIEATASYA